MIYFRFFFTILLDTLMFENKKDIITPISIEIILCGTTIYN